MSDLGTPNWLATAVKLPASATLTKACIDLNLSIAQYFATNNSILPTIFETILRIQFDSSLKMNMSTLKNVLFVPHGAPTFALDSGAAGYAIARIAGEFPTPRAVLCISPHWETSTPTLGTARQLETIYDFYGFDERLYKIKYPATGCPELAVEIQKVMLENNFECLLDPGRGLDHGAWIPLRQIYPDANIPIVPLSLQGHAGPEYAYKLGQVLSELPDRGILILASGNLTHNLGDYRQIKAEGGTTPEYIQRFADWLHEMLSEGDIDSLINYRKINKDGARAHPTEEHLLPLFVALGAAGKEARAQAFYRGINDYVLAMDAYIFRA